MLFVFRLVFAPRRQGTPRRCPSCGPSAAPWTCPCRNRSRSPTLPCARSGRGLTPRSSGSSTPRSCAAPTRPGRSGWATASSPSTAPSSTCRARWPPPATTRPARTPTTRRVLLSLPAAPAVPAPGRLRPLPPPATSAPAALAHLQALARPRPGRLRPRLLLVRTALDPPAAPTAGRLPPPP